jgi:hypothetical protein
MPLYVYRCQHCQAAQELVRSVRHYLDPVICDCGVPMVLELQGAFVVPDIAPYKAVAGDRAGQWITSRRKHKEFLKRNKLIEIGNEKPKDTKLMRPIHTDKERREIREQMRPIVREALRNDRRRNA